MVLDDLRAFTFIREKSTVGAILTQMVTTLGLEMECRGDVVVVWKKAAEREALEAQAILLDLLTGMGRPANSWAGRPIDARRTSFADGLEMPHPPCVSPPLPAWEPLC